MNRNDIICMAKEAEAWDLIDHNGIAALVRFAHLVAAEEREAMQKIAEAELSNTAMLASMPPQSSAAWNILQAIRKRNET